VTQRYFKPGADRHTGETPAFTKKRKKNRAKAKLQRAARRKQR
jgi:hypothetical protein